MTTIVHLEHVSKSFRSRAETVHAVADFTLEIRAGELAALVGPSGSGKSTLINLIIGWEYPDSGSIMRHRELGDDWASVGVVPQGLGLLPELTIKENIELPTVLGNSERHDPSQLRERLALRDVLNQLPEHVSLGEQQRAAVARALVSQPRLLIVDEPTAHQDEANTMLVAEMLREAAHAGSAVLIATHDVRVLAAADQVVEILDGRLQGRTHHT